MAQTINNPDGFTREPDGFTATTHPSDDRMVRYQPAALAFDPSRKIPSLYAAQLAVASLLKGTVATVKDDENVATGRSQNGRAVAFEPIYIDWPPNEAELAPAQATILEVDEQDFGDEVSAARYLEDTADKFGEGTVIFRQSFSMVKLAVHMTFGHRDDRRAFRAELEDWLSEPQSDRMGRQVIVPAYYGAQVMVGLMSLQNQDDGDAAQKNIFTLIAGILCRVPVLRLVQRPARLRPRVDAGVE